MVDGSVEEEVPRRALNDIPVHRVHLLVIELMPACRAGSAAEGSVVAALHRSEMVHHAVQVVLIRDAIFRKMANQNQTNEMVTTETKYQTDFYSAEKIPIFNQILTRAFSKDRQNTKKIPRNLGQKYQIPIWFWYIGVPKSNASLSISSESHFKEK